MGARETCSALKLKFKTDNNNYATYKQRLSEIFMKYITKSNDERQR